MGIRVITDYESLEGASISSAYLRIQNTNVSFPRDDPASVRVVVSLAAYVSRDAAMRGCRELLNNPIPQHVSLTLLTTDTWNSLGYIYQKVKEELGKTFDNIEDVLESEQVPVGTTQ